MKATLIESAQEHHWVLLDARVTQLVIDPSSFRFQAWSLDASAEVRVAAPFTLHLPSGAERSFDPEQTEGLAPALAILRRPLQSLTITRAGELTADFGDGMSIVVRPHARYEAWEVQGGGSLEGMDYLCHAGGGTPWEVSAFRK
jgi:Family of unknown function (DUF6188)